MNLVLHSEDLLLPSVLHSFSISFLRAKQQCGTLRWCNCLHIEYEPMLVGWINPSWSMYMQ